MKRIVFGLIFCMICFSQTISAISLSYSVPANGAKNVAAKSNLVLVFNENVSLGDGLFYLNGVSITPTVAGKYLIFTPTMNYFTAYTLVIQAGAVKSTAGEIYAQDSILFTTAPSPMPSGCQTDVSPDGAGAYTSIQAAIDAAPSESSNRYVIYVRKGEYAENVQIPANKKNITLWGEHLSHVVLQSSKKEVPTMSIEGEGCYVFNMSIRNLSEDSIATAVQINADKTMMRYCEIAGTRKVLHTDACRTYFYQCYIEGCTQLINSLGTAYFDYCHLKASEGGAAVTAETPTSSQGMVFQNTQLIGTASNLTVGKAMNASAAISYQQSIFPSNVATNAWDKNGFENARLTEYMNFGPGAKTYDGIFYLPTEEVENYTALNVLKKNVLHPETTDEWNPFTTLANTGKNADTWLEGEGLGANKGGNGGSVVTVSSVSDLKKYATAEQPYIIQVKGVLSFSGGAIEIASNKTITGIDESSTLVGNLRINSGVSNVIIKYINITHPGELKVNDGISMEGAHRVLVHHVSFYDCSDGCCDMRNSTDSVTVCWNKLYYVTQTDGHRFTMIADGAMIRDADGVATDFLEPLQITFHHNWWSTMCDQRMPSSTNAIAHFYNCYWSCTGNYYCSLARDNSHFYSEYNYYNGVRNPLYKGTFSSKIYSSNNTFYQCLDAKYTAKDDVSKPDYKYLPGATKDVPSIVSARAGNFWIDTNYQPTSIDKNVKNNAALISTDQNGLCIQLQQPSDKTKVSIYSLQGQLLHQQTLADQQQMDIKVSLQQGIYIVKLKNQQSELSKVVCVQ